MSTVWPLLAQVLRVVSIGSAAAMLGLGGCSSYDPMKVTIHFYGGDNANPKVQSAGAPVCVDVMAVVLPLDDDDKVDQTRISVGHPSRLTGDTYWLRNGNGKETKVTDFAPKTARGELGYRKRFTSGESKTLVLTPQDPIWREWLEVDKANHLLIISNGNNQKEPSLVPLLRELYEGDPEVTIAADDESLTVTPKYRQ
jgi:hypothetical protein